MKTMKFLNKLLGVLALVACLSSVAYGQDKGVVIDKIIARVDNYVVLLSDVEKGYQSIFENGETPGPNARCELLQGLIVNKIMVAKAEIDSVIVEDATVTSELTRRMRYFEMQAGGADKPALPDAQGT